MSDGPRASALGLRQVAYFDCPGGGQVVVDGRVAYIAHMKAPHGTTLVDVSDPAAPRQLATLEVPTGTHSHKVRAGNGLMLVNREAQPAHQPPAGALTGLGIFDVSQPSRPREIAFWPCGGAGVHRFTFDGRFAYVSPEMDGYLGNIVMILDLMDPTRPREIGRWWMPGQWTAGGETPSWSGRQHRCHHPIRLDNRLYVSYWHGGFVILDIDDMARPPFLWLVDITDERRPVPFACFQVAGVGGQPQPEFTGCHQPCERVTGTDTPVAWFAHGLRIVDIAKPHAPREVAHFLPEPPQGHSRVSSNDVEVDDRGLLYLIDRGRGLH